MPIHPKKLKAFADGGKDKQKGKPHDDDDHDEKPDHDDDGGDDHHDDGGNGGDGHGKKGGGKDKGPPGGKDKGGGGGPKVDLKKAEQDSADLIDDELEDHLQGYDPEVDGNPPEWVADEGTWEKAKQAVKGKWDDYDEPYAVVTYVYKQMGGAFKGGGSKE
jgi:hypothetical protein